MRSLLAAAALVLIASAALAQGEITYDRFKNTTTLKCPSTEGFRLPGITRLVVMVAVKGKEFPKPIPDGAAFFALFARNQSWEYLHDHGVDLLLDGTARHLESEHDGDVRRGYVIEYVASPVEIETLSEVAVARAVEMRVGRTEIRFDAEMQKRLRGCLEQIRVELPLRVEAIVPDPPPEPE